MHRKAHSSLNPDAACAGGGNGLLFLISTDGGVFALDWNASKSTLPEETPTLVLIHGINGNSD